MTALRCILALLVLLFLLLALQFVTASKASTRLRSEAVHSWVGNSDIRRAYGEALIGDCGSGLSLVLERREKAVDLKTKTCSVLLANSEVTQQIGLTPEDVALLETMIDAAYAKSPIPAPLSWL